MAWFDKNDAKVPEELRNASAEELYAALQFHKANKDKLVQVEGELSTTKTTLANVENQFVETKRRLEALEANPPAPAPQPKDPSQAAKPTDFFDDPEKAFAERVGPLAQYVVDSRVDVARMSFEDWLGQNPGAFGDRHKIYKKYQDEVLDLMKNEPPLKRANPQVWKNAFTLIVGHHDEEIHKARTSKDNEFFGEVANPRVQDLTPKDEISDADRLAAKNYGISPESVFEARKGMRFSPDGSL